MAPLALLAALLALTTPAATHSAPRHRRCTAAQFRPWSQRVWSPRGWRRGRPAARAIRAERRALACAGPANHAAIRHRWRADMHRFFAHRRYCRSGVVWEGRVSTFTGGSTALAGRYATEPGIALRSDATLGQTFILEVGGHRDRTEQIDWGPAEWTGRAIDITEAEAARLGGVTTDSWGRARLLPRGCV